MKISNIVRKRSISSDNLKNRLNLNKKLGSVDLTSWLFKRYKIKKNELLEPIKFKPIKKGEEITVFYTVGYDDIIEA